MYFFFNQNMSRKKHDVTRVDKILGLIQRVFTAYILYKKYNIIGTYSNLLCRYNFKIS